MIQMRKSLPVIATHRNEQTGISHVIYSWPGCYFLNSHILSLSAVLRWVTDRCHESSPRAHTENTRIQYAPINTGCWSSRGSRFKVCTVLCVLIIVPSCQAFLPLVLPAFNQKARSPICNLAGHNYHGHCNNQLQIQWLRTLPPSCVSVCRCVLITLKVAPVLLSFLNLNYGVIWDNPHKRTTWLAFYNLWLYLIWKQPLVVQGAASVISANAPKQRLLMCKRRSPRVAVVVMMATKESVRWHDWT